MLRRALRGQVAWAAVLVVSLGLTPPFARLTPAEAAPLPPGSGEPTTRDGDLARIVRTLETRLVGAHLRGLGIDVVTVEARLARLDDAQLHELAQALPHAGLGGQETERALGAFLLYAVALVILAGLVYFAVSGSGF